MNEDLLDLIDFLMETEGDDTTTVGGYVVEDGIRHHVALTWDAEGDEFGVLVKVNGTPVEGVCQDTGGILESFDKHIESKLKEGL